MRVLVVSGIWPPDVGGPASHAPEVASFLVGHGHVVHVLVTAAAAPAAAEYPVAWVRRSLPRGVRHLRTVQRATALAGRADVVYSTGMFARSSLAAAMARKPIVLKLTADPAYERARRAGVFGGSLSEFQRDRSARTLPFRAARDAAVRNAAHVVCPSTFLRDLAAGWGIDPASITVLPNPAPAVNGLASREELRDRLALAGPTLVFAGRLTAQKSLEVAFAAAERAGVDLLVAGEGPERGRLERAAGPRVRFLGPQPRAHVLELYRAADAALLSSAWENFPHAVVEALAVGTPVVSTDVGGVSEVVRDGVNGALVPPGDVEALAAAIARVIANGEQLRRAAAASVDDYASERVYGRLESILTEAVG